MLSIGKLGAGQAGYYQRQVAHGRDDYYSGRGEAPGEWAGRGAETLGLSGMVEAAQFNALMAGIDPSDRDLERPLRDSRGETKVVGFDLTFSAPKSVSVLFAAADEAVAGTLIEAHEAAVRAALEYVEDEAVKVRRGKAGAIVEPGRGVVAAAYRHRMSRALDPQLHTHVVCANVSQGSDGRWTALDGRHLYQHATTAGYLYQAHLRAEVRARLGLEWGPVTKGAAELLDVDAAVLEEFSRRRQEIVAAAIEAGVTDLASERGKHLAITTRERKQYGIETHTWRDEVRARAAEHGLDREALQAITQRGEERVTSGALAPAAVDERAIGDRLAGPHGLTVNNNTFAEREVLREHAAAAAQGAFVAEVRERGERFAARGDVRPTLDGSMTTQDLVTSERRLIAAAIGRAGEGTGRVSKSIQKRALASLDRSLTEEQASAVADVVGSGNGVDVIEALAGTGKTFTAGALRQIYEEAGHPVLGVAPTGRAVRELTEEAGVASFTLDRILLDLDAGDRLPDQAVVILDEAGMAATRGTERLLAAAELAGAKVIAVGDSGQLPSVQAGGWMGEVGRRLGAHRLQQVLRQRDIGERRALAQLHAGQPAGYMEWAERSGRVAFHLEGGAVDAALEDWMTAAAAYGLAEAVLIARDNDTRAALNAAARGHVGALGQLGRDVQYGSVTLAVGDRVICRRNDRRADVDNGTRGTILATGPNAVIVTTDAGVERTLPSSYVADHVEHAYCLTGHGMQGGTVEHATVVAASPALTRGWSYTALSRARAKTVLHVDGHQGVVTAQAQTERAQVAHDDLVEVAPDHEALRNRVVARMQDRDDEDLAVAQLAPDEVPGRADDHELISAPVDELLERGAAVTPTARASVRVLEEMQDELGQLRELRGRLPMQALAEAEALDVEIGQVAAHRADITRQLDGLPSAPAQRVLRGRSADPYAVERERLAAAAAAAERQLTALNTQRDRTLGPRSLEALKSERSGIDRRIADVGRDAELLRDRLAERVVHAAPKWAVDEFGARPAHPRAAEQWDRGVRAIARYRLDQRVGDDVSGLGHRPAGDVARAAFRDAATEVERVHHRLGQRRSERRELDR